MFFTVEKELEDLKSGKFLVLSISANYSTKITVAQL